MNPFTSSQAAKQKKPSPENFLTSVLQQQQHCLDQVLQLLHSESEAIIKRDIESMGHILDKKLPLLSKIEQLDKQRQQYFSQQTELAYQHKAFSHFVEQHCSASIQTIWQTIKDKLAECKTQNELNGRMIAMKKDNTEQILQILLGRPANSPPTYSHLGQTNMQKRSALYTAV